MKPVAWHHLCCSVPDEWEITAYAIERRQGRLEFSTRHGFQALIGWEPCKRTPDTTTMMIGFLRRHVPGAGSGRAVSLDELKIRTINGYTVGICPGMPVQAMKYLESEKILLNWVFEGDGEALLSHVVDPVLQSCAPNDGAVRAYTLYGLDIRLPEAYEIESMHVLPANVMMAFESTRTARAVFRRWGLPRLVLQERSLEAFYPWLLRGAGATVTDAGADTIRGMDEALVRFSQRGVYRMDKFMGRRWTNGEGRLWHNRDEQRLYAFEQIGPPGVPLLEFEKAVKHG